MQEFEHCCGEYSLILDMPTISIIIKGKVQGVYYRASAVEAARRAGCRGWVRNLADGRGEAVATGEEVGLDSFVGWCRKGPAGAVVTEVVVTVVKDADFDGFSIVRG
jgi:acylphosphatase